MHYLYSDNYDFISVYIYKMSIYTTGLRKRPTYEELIGEINTDYKVTLPNRKAKFLMNSRAMSFLDEESYTEMEDQAIARKKHTDVERIIQEEAAKTGGTASVLRASLPRQPPPHEQPNMSSAGSTSQGTYNTTGGYVLDQVNRIQQGDDKNTQNKSKAMPQLFDIGSPIVSGIPMEIDDPFKTSNPAQKRSIEDPDPNYGNLITKPKSKPKPMPKASPKLQPASDPSSSSSAAAAAVIVSSDDDDVKTISIKKQVKKIKKTDPEETATVITVDPASPAIKANILKTSAGSTKDKTYKKRHWIDMNIDMLHAKVKQLGIHLTPEQLAPPHPGAIGRYTKDKLANIIMERLNKS